MTPATTTTHAMPKTGCSHAFDAAGQFRIPGDLVAVVPLGGGNVNDTYVAHFRTSYDETRVILQRINRHVFQQPQHVVANMRLVTNHIHERLARERLTHDRIWQLPRMLTTRQGEAVFVDSAGDTWRALSLIDSATAYPRTQSESHAEEVGRVLGQFHRLLSDFETTRLHDPLPGFHITPLYLGRYDGTRNTAEARERLRLHPAARELSPFIDARRAFCSILEDAKSQGLLLERVVHGDPKVSNFMIDNLTGMGTSIIDLDTVKPGLIHYDVGDALRSLGNPAGEETRDLHTVQFHLGNCRAFIRGYLAHARDFLTIHDRRYLYESVRLITLELGIRFFEDFLAGNRYFKTASPDHNLHRAQVQFRLCAHIEELETPLRGLLQDELTRADAGSAPCESSLPQQATT